MSFPTDIPAASGRVRFRRQALRYFCRPVFGWLQLFAMLFLVLQPLSISRAVWVPGVSSDQPYWLALNASDPQPSEGPDGSDDGTGHTVWWAQFQAALNSGVIAWWGGGSFLIDGNWVTMAPQYHLPFGDSDGDGIPDDFDPYPGDPNNNTVWWPGGTFTIDNQSVTFTARYCAANTPDNDGDGLPDFLDPYPYDAGNNNPY
jgi:hypothetical protein